MDTCDPKYIDEYRRLAATGDNFFGLSILSYKKSIGKMISRYGAKSILDYGSGRGDAYAEPLLVHREWGLDAPPTLYDPAFPTHDQKPVGKFDGVLCSDVLEHVPYGHVDNVVEELFQYADKFVWASVCCRPAKKFFAGGENMHVTICAYPWWEFLFKETSKRHPGVGWQLKETT